MPKPAEKGSKNNKEQILYLLKTRGELTATVLADLLSMTMMGARQLLQDLENNDLVHSKKRVKGRGRPKLFWGLTDKGHGRFPDRHSDLTLSLLSGISDALGPQAMDKLIAIREDQSLQQYSDRLNLQPDLREKVYELARIRSEEGYMADVEEVEDGYLLIENHCPICAAAKVCQGFCRSELSIFRQCLNAKVDRVEYLLDGARRCAYKVTDA
ncbi:transcriptional regulator [Kangiella sp. HD9-110m-PIT-SAG07]|nr:transcriptional regulator [Kangiella sp. HD9-110m-PIT-SAG07]